MKPAKTFALLSSMIVRMTMVTLLTVILFDITCAQTVSKSNTDSSTPPGMAPGAPAGAYPLGGFENVNLFNRHLNFSLPLLKVGGRGTAQVTIPLLIERKWRVVHAIQPNIVCNQQGCTTNPPTHYFIPQPNWWGGLDPGYGPGVLEGRYGGREKRVVFNCGTGTITKWWESVTRLTFTANDGTEYELRDQAFNGQPRQTADNCSENNINRGTIFVTADGSAATFISDSAIFDKEKPPTQYSTFNPSGYLMLKDGTRYRIDNGQVSWMSDRNGNRLSFGYDPYLRINTVTDSLNRQVTFSYGDHTANQSDFITYHGYGGAQRTIEIGYTSLSNALRSDQTSKTYQELFPTLNGGGSFNPSVVSYMKLPDQRQYTFYYNSYGELARIVLPTGAATEYDHSGEIISGFSDDGNNYPEREIVRYVTERRIYPDGGSGANFAVKTTYAGAVNVGLTTVSVYAYDSSQQLVLKSHESHAFWGTVAEGLFRNGAYYPSGLTGREVQTSVYDSDGTTLLRRTENAWGFRVDVSWPGAPSGQPGNDPRINETVSYLLDNGNNLVSKVHTDYDDSVPYNNPKDVYEYDFGSGAPGPLIRRTQTSYLTTNPNQGNADYAADYNIHIRNLPIQKIVYDASGTVRSQTDYVYDNYGVFAVVGRPGIVQYADTLHYGAWGNLTEVILRNPGGNPSEVHLQNQYDIAGNLVKTIDGRGFATDFDYSDRFGSPGNDARSNAGASELAGGFTYAFPTKVTNALGHTTYTQYDYYLGNPVTNEDANGVVSSVAYNDLLDRPTQGIQARYVVGVGVPAVRRQTVIVYNDSGSPVNGYPARSITTISDKDVFGESDSGNGLKSVALYDGLGRTWRGAAYEGSTWTIKDMQFNALGMVSQVSNPYRAADPSSASPPAGLWMTTEYDALGRPIKMTTPDGAHVDTAYGGNQVTVTDQAGKKRRSVTDALGRLVLVIEDPGGLNYQTSYLYDVLDNLRKVTQGGQYRWFAYDLLSRLIRAKNPEQAANSNLSYTDPVTNDGNGWSMAYSYDANGNLVSKTDARNITTNYVYDELNRNTSVDYSNTAVTDIRRYYDNTNPGSYGKGRFKEDYAGGGNWAADPNVDHTAIDSYDPLGRPLTKRQLIKRNGVVSPNYSINQAYDLAGNVKTVTYPSGRTVNYSYDQAGRLSSFSGNLGGSPATYADTISYNAAGQMIKERFGMNTSLYNNLHYNNRMQLVDTRVGDSETDEWNRSRGAITLLYGSTAVANGDMFANDTDNNGNLRRQINYAPLAGGGYVIPQRDDYTYDALNRISSFTEAQMDSGGQWTLNVASQNCSYDRYGNRQITSASGGVNNYNPGYDQTTNRINGLGYDAAGNIASDPMTGGLMTYDAENRLQTATKGGIGSSYTYNADGRRVRRIIGGQETWQVYGIGGELLAEYAASAAPSAPQKEYGCRGGQLLVVWDGGETGDRQLQWLVQDHLGSTRMVVDRSGTLGGIRRHDFAPFGEELIAGAAIRSGNNGYSGDSVRQKFGSKERDNETGLDYFLARYYSSIQGRFTSPDLPFADQNPQDPQSWNLYSYTRNNPLRYTDPTGRSIGSFFERLKNYIVWGVYATDTHLNLVEFERRQWLNDNYYVKDSQGNWTHIDFFNNYSRATIWAFWDNVQEDIKNGDAYNLTPEEIASALPAPGKPALKDNPYHPDEVAKRAGELGKLQEKMQSLERAAERLGFDKVVKDPPFNSHGQKVFTDGTRYLTRDIDSHIGGMWKMFNRAGQRLGTYNANLVRIGD